MVILLKQHCFNPACSLVCNLHAMPTDLETSKDQIAIPTDLETSNSAHVKKLDTVKSIILTVIIKILHNNI